MRALGNAERPGEKHRAEGTTSGQSGTAQVSLVSKVKVRPFAAEKTVEADRLLQRLLGRSLVEAEIVYEIIIPLEVSDAKRVIHHRGHVRVTGNTSRTWGRIHVNRRGLC